MNPKILFFVFTVTVFIGSASFAQEKESQKFNLSFDARGDFAITQNDNTDKLHHGFAGKNLNLMFDGELSDKFSVKVRQRFNKPINSEVGLFNATDIMSLKYKATEKFSIIAGKQIVSLGGFEYDYAPIDLYFLSKFTNNFPSCYEFGIAANYTLKNDLFGFQFINSPLAANRNGNDGIYAYNLIWYGNHNWFNSIYSFNMMEYDNGKFVNYITLGNQFNFQNFCFEFDFQNRTMVNKIEIFKNFSLIGNLKYRINDQWTIFAKGGYDQNKSSLDSTAVFPYLYTNEVPFGEEYSFAGFGAELFPLKERKNIRIHTYFAITNNLSEKFLFNIGCTWRIKAI